MRLYLKLSIFLFKEFTNLNFVRICKFILQGKKMKVAVMFANGFEEIEAISIIDILRRAEIDAINVGLEKKLVLGAHKVELKTDIVLDDLVVDEFDMIVLPGGLQGAQNLAQSQKLGEILRKFDDKNKKIAAICAAPWALATSGVLKDEYACYPGFEKTIAKDGYMANLKISKCKNIITANGPATAIEFALTLVGELLGKEKQDSIAKDLLFA